MTILILIYLLIGSLLLWVYSLDYKLKLYKIIGVVLFWPLIIFLGSIDNKNSNTKGK